MPHSTASDSDSDGIDLTNRELVSLFIQYPDMVNLPGDDDSQSGDSSDSEEDVDATTLSATTNHTTPLRNEPLTVLMVSPRPAAEYPAFLQRLNQSNLPKRAIDYFTALGQIILQIGQTLFPPTGNMSVNQDALEEVCNMSDHLVSLLESSCQRVNDQIDNIAYILTLAPFAVQPTPEDLWPNYKQMAELIVK